MKNARLGVRKCRLDLTIQLCYENVPFRKVNMPVYEYTALDVKGKKQKGIIDAGSVNIARQRLRENQVYPIEFRETLAGKKEETLSKISFSTFFKRVKAPDVSIMTRQLSTLLAAGLPLVPCLNILVNQISNEHLRKVLAQVKEEVNEGASLSQSLSHFPRIFPAFYVNMVRAGEASGTINLVLERLADFSDKQQALLQKVKTAMMYPAIILIVGLLMMLYLVTNVVPEITKVYGEMHQTLPFVTVLLISISGFLKAFWWAILALAALGVVAAHYAVTKTAEGRLLRDRMLLRLPLIGTLTRKLAVARFSRTLGTLLQSGVPLLTALGIVKNVISNALIGNAIQDASNEVEEGQSLSAPLAKSGLFPPMATEMIAVGEQSGNLEPMLYRISDAYEKEVETSIGMMTSVVEPVMIIVMGFMVGFIVISVLLPIFEMNQLVK
jgi:general secretion pathway protein F